MNPLKCIFVNRIQIYSSKILHTQSFQHGNSSVFPLQLENIVESLSDETSAGFQDKLSKLENHNKYWPFELAGQKALASLVHNLYCNKRHNDILLITNKLKSINYDIWGGLATIILYSAIDQKKWKEAIDLFESMRDRGQLKHVRLYKHLIVELAEDDNLSAVLKYFHELCKLESCSTRLKSPDVLMLVSLIKAACRNKNWLSSLVIDTVLVYLENKDGRLLCGVILELLQYFKSNTNYSVIQAKFKEGVCENCCYKLVQQQNYEILCNMIINGIDRNIDMDIIDEMIEYNNGFNIIIDAGNVLYHGKGKQQRNLAGVNLENTLLDIKKKYDKLNILVIFPKNYPPLKLQNLSYMQELSFNVTSFVPKFTNDDVLILYVAAKSELKKSLFGVVSNDSFIDHSYLAESSIKSWISFLHDRLKPFKLSGCLEDKASIRSVILNDTSIHLFDGSIGWCINKARSVEQ